MNRSLRMQTVVAALALAMLAGACSTLDPQQASSPDEQAAPHGSRVSARPPAGGPLPVVLLLVDEKNVGSIPTAEVEALGQEMLVARGFRTVDQDMLRSNLEQRQKLLKAAGDNRAAATLGLQYGAELMVIGEAVCKPSAQRIADTSLRAYQAVVTLRAVRSDNASVIATASETGNAMDIEDVRGSSKALKSAAQACLSKLLPAAETAWLGGGATDAFAYRLELTVGGVDQLWKVKALRDNLRSLACAQDLIQRTYTAGAVVFDLRANKRAEELAEDLVLNPPPGLTLQVLAIEAGKITLHATAN